MPSRKLLKICFDRVLEGNEAIDAAGRAVEERVDNLPIIAMPPGSSATPQPLQLALESRTLWKPGRVLRVRFLDGDSKVHAKVEQVARAWEQFANIKFDFGNDPDAEIRIGFIRGAGSWSWLGTDALARPKDEPTMNLGWLHLNTPFDEYNRVVLHEFGHALGCIHEHQSPAADIPWNKPAVYRAYGGPPNNWSEAQTDVNLFNRYAASQTQFTEFDLESIMLYPIPKDLTDGEFETQWNKELSPMDKSFIETVYPFDTKPVIGLAIGASPTEAEIGKHGEEDTFRFVIPSQGMYTIETGGRTDVLMGLFGPDDRQTQIAHDDDSGRGLNAKIIQELQPGTYYLRVRHFRPRGQGKYVVSVKSGA